ncbi:MAG: hypothetical protein IKQ83_01000 [Lachnospiraceae bacterium]|jgi:DNA-binding LytR/AlgR family response regulator|nr:hypothetical protein [Lachnospiraceae bacterium]
MDTSLHIALCDSDPGDRKQMERLLSRESDKRLPVTGGFYTDTFGGVEAILRSPMLYDVYFLDSTDPLCDSYQIAKAIRDKGILSPIVYCISSIDYRQSGPMLPNCVFMNKPIKVADLSLVLDEIITQKKENYIPTIELRNQYETFYLEAKNVLYFSGNGYSVDVHLTDGSIRQATAFLDSLWRDLYSFPVFQIISPTTIVNTMYIAKLGPMSVLMRDSTKHSVKSKYFANLKKKMANYKEER